ncbi:MAG TPA: ABC transporter permease [Planctomycetota bacterium]|nr:ABC transporter permease [Planctomycetota bacterium]
MTRSALILKSARFHWRANLGALLAAAAGCAVLVGALIVGDSVRYTLHTMAVERLGATDVALLGQDRFFKQDLAARLGGLIDQSNAGFFRYESMLLIPGVCATDKNQLRANDVQVCGVVSSFWLWDLSPYVKEFNQKCGQLARGEAVINEKLAQLLQAQAGDTIRIRLYKPGILPHDAPLGGREDQAAFLRVKVSAVIPSRGLGRFSLNGNQTTPANIYVRIEDLQESVEQKGRANILLFTENIELPDRTDLVKKAAGLLKTCWSLDDAELKLREDKEHNFAELSTPRVFLDDALSDELLKDKGASGVTTYFVNAIRANGKETPYSMVTAGVAPLVDADLKDDEIILTQWTAGDLGAKAGDSVELEFYTVGLLRKLDTKKASFKVKSVVPIDGLRADKQLMPDFPGISDVDSTHDWKAGVPIDMKKIRQKDEDYWKKYRGTPKAFITLKRGTELWKNRFGTYTALRFPSEKMDGLTQRILSVARPDKLGMPLLPVKEQALNGAAQSMDFGGLFLGLSFFLIAAALLLMALIFQFGVEARARETGVLLALGFSVRSVRFLLWSEGLAAAALGAPLGVIGGFLYARWLILALTKRWQGAVGGAALDFHAEPLSIVIGALSAIFAAAIAIYFAVRKQAARPARELLAARGGEIPSAPKKLTAWKIAGALGLFSAFFLIAFGFKSSGEEAAGMFFGSGAALLIFALAMVRWVLNERLGNAGAPPAPQPTAAPSLIALGLRAARRRPGRSLATVALLASGAFLVSAVGVNELDAAAGANLKTSGTGGFALFGRSTIPIFDDLNTKQGRDKAGVPDKGLEHVTIYPLRVKSGDEASCLNLNRPQRPRILGVPEPLVERGGFTFANVLKSQSPLQPNENPWHVLHWRLYPDQDMNEPIPAICDAQSMQWALHLSLGDELTIDDERGKPHRLKLVGALENSILQGNILIAEDQFLSLYPSESGYRYFLIDAPEPESAAVAKTLADALQDSGFEAQTAVSRLAEFNAVQNTYLATFQALGGLGLLLGTLGLGIVVLRNMLDRRAELAMLRAIGFSRRDLGVMILAEHTWLLLVGLIAGAFAALCAIAPTLNSFSDLFKWRSMHWMLLGILGAGLSAMLIAAWSALRAPLLEALNSE